MNDRGCGRAEGHAACCQKAARGRRPAAPASRFAENNEDCSPHWADAAQVAGGTAWLWARPEAFDTLDVLFVDEAAQMSLANVLAVSQARRPSC